MLKKDFKKIDEVVLFGNYLYSKFLSNKFLVSIDESRSKSIIVSELKSNLKDLENIEKYVIKSNKIIKDFMSDKILIPSNRVKDYKYLMSKLDKDNGMIAANDLIVFFINNYYDDEKLSTKNKSIDSIDKLTNSIQKFMEKFIDLPEYNRLVKNKGYDDKNDKLAKISENDISLDEMDDAIKKVRNNNTQLYPIFNNNSYLRTGSDTFFGWAIHILTLQYFFKTYFVIKIRIITKFIDANKKYIYK